MSAEFECAVCHWAVFDAVGPRLGGIDRKCQVCIEIESIARDHGAAYAAQLRELVDHPIVEPGTGRAIIAERLASSRLGGSQ